MPQVAPPTGLAKRQEIESILSILKNDPLAKKSTPQERVELLKRLKLLGSLAKDADPLYEKKAIKTLAAAGVSANLGQAAAAAKEALRCLANALLLEPRTRQYLVDSGSLDDVVKLLQDDDAEVQGICARILFLVTYGTSLDLHSFAKNQDLVNGINKILAQLEMGMKARAENSSTPRTAAESLALSETLKLLFNVTYYSPEANHLFKPSAKPMLEILRHGEILEGPKQPLEPPVSHLIHAIMNVELEGPTLDILFPEGDPTCYTKCLVDILEDAVNDYKPGELDGCAAPLLTLLRTHLQYAPEQVKEYLAQRILPTDAERDKPLGKSDTLASRLLYFSTSALTPNIRDSILSLMFELSGKDVDEFVKNVGYGYASGFLVNHNLPAPSQSGSADAATSGEVNFVTGQYLASEPTEEEQTPMTEDEKLREAEKLYVLFERLKRTGVVDVENPVETAARSGRFEEID